MPEREEARAREIVKQLTGRIPLLDTDPDHRYSVSVITAALKSAQATPTTKQITDSPTYQRLDAYRLELERDLAQAREEIRRLTRNEESAAIRALLEPK